MNRLICYVTILPQVTPTITSDPLIILAVHRRRLLSLYTAIQIYVLLTYLLTVLSDVPYHYSCHHFVVLLLVWCYDFIVMIFQSSTTWECLGLVLNLLLCSVIPVSCQWLSWQNQVCAVIILFLCVAPSTFIYGMWHYCVAFRNLFLCRITISRDMLQLISSFV